MVSETKLEFLSQRTIHQWRFAFQFWEGGYPPFYDQWLFALLLNSQLPKMFEFFNQTVARQEKKSML